MKAIILIAILSFFVLATCDHYAVLVAGSYQYKNYRHQADICHAYQIMIKNGMKPENIIVMMYNDVVNHYRNPFPGKLFNKPGKGVDVYAGCKIDYEGDDVTPQNFLSVITGDSAAVGGKKVLKSTKKDKVFINFSDHGAPGLIAFPKSYLYADDFIKALKTMHEKQMYEQLTVYIEACESGSMFEGILPDDINIYATTAANPSEPSAAEYCYDTTVDGKRIGSCLGDLYSVAWMENADGVAPGAETLQKQFDLVKQRTTASHAQQYGQLSFVGEPIGDFMGVLDTGARKLRPNKYHTFESEEPTFALSQRDANLMYYYQQYMKTQSPTDAMALQQEITRRTHTELKFQQFSESIGIPHVNEPHLPKDYPCLKEAIEVYRASCGAFEEYALKFTKTLVAACNMYGTEEVIDHLVKTCQ